MDVVPDHSRPAVVRAMAPVLVEESGMVKRQKMASLNSDSEEELEAMPWADACIVLHGVLERRKGDLSMSSSSANVQH